MIPGARRPQRAAAALRFPRASARPRAAPIRSPTDSGDARAGSGRRAAPRTDRSCGGRARIPRYSSSKWSRFASSSVKRGSSSISSSRRVVRRVTGPWNTSSRGCGSKSSLPGRTGSDTSSAPWRVGSQPNSSSALRIGVVAEDLPVGVDGPLRAERRELDRLVRRHREVEELAQPGGPHRDRPPDARRRERVAQRVDAVVASSRSTR